MGHLTTALYLELFPWLINLPVGWAWLTEVAHGWEHRAAPAVQTSHPACGGLWGCPAPSRDAAQQLPARRDAALGREAAPSLWGWLNPSRNPRAVSAGPQGGGDSSRGPPSLCQRPRVLPVFPVCPCVSRCSRSPAHLYVAPLSSG